MKTRQIMYATALALACAFSFGAVVAQAGIVSYISPKHVFSLNDVMCDDNVFGTACLSPEPMVFEKDGQEYYGIDSAYGSLVRDFTPPVLLPMDGVYDNGMINTVTDDYGQAIGVHAISQITAKYKNGALGGEWAAGLGGLSVKAATEHYLVMDHVLNAEWMPPLVEVERDPLTGEPLNVGDFATRLKDDGKILFFWGNLKKVPTPLRLYTTVPLPEAWKAPGANYTVTSAKLVVKHRITTSPNDQIRPEDFENENATGILPQYTAVPQLDTDGNPLLGEDGKPLEYWYSTIDAYEGDGDFIPAGTMLRDIVPYRFDVNGDGIYDYIDYKTNAWYTTMDRDPFGGLNPRYRLKSSKYGQDIPGVEIPQYPAGQLTTTTLDLLSIKDEEGHAILAQSANWFDYLDINEEKFDFVDDDFTADGCPLTPDFDLMIYVKGEYSGTDIYDAQLIVEYDDPAAEDPPPTDAVDVAITAVNLPKIRKGETGELVVTLKNELPGIAYGTLEVVLEDQDGNVFDTLTTGFETTPASTDRGIIFSWTAPIYKTVVTATATAIVDGDIDLTDNEAKGTVLVK